MTDLTAHLEATRTELADQGFNLWGIVDAERFDASEPPGRRLADALPGCRSAIVIGSGGSKLWHTMLERQGQPGRPRPWRHPIDAFSTVSIDAAVERLSAAIDPQGRSCRLLSKFPFASGVHLRRPNSSLNFKRLGEEAGFGVVSPVLHLLIHPTFGPWVSLRGAVLSDLELPATGVLDDFAPFTTCHRPCVAACPAGVFEPAGPHFSRCADHRHAGGCADGCDARRACPVGKNHRFGADEERFRHAYPLFLLRRHSRKGLWSLLPRRS
jgi:hypothetical protein